MIEIAQNAFFTGIALGMIVGALFDEFLYYMDRRGN